MEAISNLAATLLALDRREEALHNWLRAVKLRPSFFEAVEHLIGLLCTSHRGREAVNIIDFVQTSLRHPRDGDCFKADEHASEPESDAESNVSDVNMYDKASFDYDDEMGRAHGLNLGSPDTTASPGFASSGYAILAQTMDACWLSFMQREICCTPSATMRELHQLSKMQF